MQYARGGYDIRELENRDGKFYTPDGEDLWEVLKDKYDKLAAEGNADVSTLMRYETAYRRVATAGWERTTDSRNGHRTRIVFRNCVWYNFLLLLKVR